MADDNAPQRPASPFHAVIIPPNDNSQPSQLLESKFERDYISKRHRTFEQAKIKTDVYESGLWKGVSSLERSLVSCCERPKNSGTSKATGALAKNKVLPFLRLVVLYCHDCYSRILALAILERSLDEDGVDHQERLKTVEGNCSLLSNEPAEKRARLSDESEKEERVAMLPEKDAATLACTELTEGRVKDFLTAGGLHVLNRWLIDASTPLVSCAKIVTGSRTNIKEIAIAPSCASDIVKSKASSTGAILLELIRFLVKIPFNRVLVTTSKINKPIRDLSKQVDGILEKNWETTPSSLKTLVHEVSGGLPVMAVKDALDELKLTWANKFKAASVLLTASNPQTASIKSDCDHEAFLKLKKQLSERLENFQAFTSGNAEKPTWLSKIEEKKLAKDSNKLKKSCANNEQLDRRERENERAFWMKKDLREAEEERRRLLKKYRELKQKHELEGRKAQVICLEPKKSVRWKDGFTAASRARKRNLLEEVFIFASESSKADISKANGVTNNGKKTEDLSFKANLFDDSEAMKELANTI